MIARSDVTCSSPRRGDIFIAVGKTEDRRSVGALYVANNMALLRSAQSRDTPGYKYVTPMGEENMSQSAIIDRCTIINCRS